MSAKGKVNKIFKKVWDDHHIQPYEFQALVKERQKDVDEYRGEKSGVFKITEEHEARAKKACELITAFFKAEDRAEAEKIHDELEEELKAINKEKESWLILKVYELQRVKCLAKKHEKKEAYTSRRVRYTYRKTKLDRFGRPLRR